MKAGVEASLQQAEGGLDDPHVEGVEEVEFQVLGGELLGVNPLGQQTAHQQRHHGNRAHSNVPAAAKPCVDERGVHTCVCSRQRDDMREGTWQLIMVAICRRIQAKTRSSKRYRLGAQS